MIAHLEQSKMGKVDKKEALNLALKSEELKMLMEDNIRSVRRVDKIIDNDLEEPFHNLIPISGAL